MNSFNLVDEPWISCADPSGTTREYSLIELFSQAHELRGLANESPLIDAAVLRLLLAILHRCFGPKDNAAWMMLRQGGSFPRKPLEAYLKEWHGRFDLFHGETPFYQVPKLVDQTTNYERGKKPAREMIAEQSSYGAPRELFASRPDESFPIDFGAAARWLVSLQAFHTGGLLTRDVNNGDPTSVQAAPLCGSAVVTLQGDNLFEALLLNLLPYPDSRIFPSSRDDAPAWERPPLTKFRRRACRGWLDWLTWQSRRIQLFGDAQYGVTEFILLGGNELQAENPPRDPMCAYKKHDKFGWVPIRFTQERALWRDSVALVHIPSSGREGFRGPEAVSQLASRGGEHGRSLRLQVYGQMPNKASIVLTRTETLPLPVALLERGELIGCISDELKKAEDAQLALRSALFWALQNVLATGDRDPDAKDVTALLDSTQGVPRYWANVKPLFDRFLLELAEDEDHASKRFRSGLRATSLAVFDQSVNASSRASRALKGFTVGRIKLLGELAKSGLNGSTATKAEKAEDAR